MELRGEGFYIWLTFMISTADELELNEKGYWEGKINDSGLPAARKKELLDLLSSNRKTFADKAA